MKIKKKNKKKKKYQCVKINKNKIINSNYFIPKIDNNVVDIKTNTFFDIKKYTNASIELNDSFNSNVRNYNEPITNKENIIPTWIFEKDKNELRARQTELIINNDYQKEIILRWIEIARVIYNITVYYFRKNKMTSFYKARPIIKKLLSKEINLLIKRYQIPEHIKDNAIKDVIKAYNSAEANRKAGNIKKFLIRYKKAYKDKQTIVIERGDFSTVKNGFYVKILKEEDEEFTEFETRPEIELTQKNIKHAVRLTYYKYKNKFILNIPIDIIKENIITNNKVFIDGGNKTFLSLYNPKGECYKIFNRDENKNLFNLVERRNLLKNIIEEKYNKKYDMVLRNPKLIKKFNKCYNQVTNRIQNLVNELHNKSANFLCTNYDKILLGKLSTKGITSKKNNMSPSEKRYTYAISHDKFRTVLKNKIEKYNYKELYIVDESYTTKTCGNCGIINNKVGSNRVFNCLICNSKIDRDLNSARLIGIKNE